MNRKKIRSTVTRKREDGIVLMIALIVLVAMSLAGVALVRSVDTSTQIAGNLAFRQGVVQEADRGIEEANNALSTTIRGSNTVDNTAANYYATRQAGEDTRGVPAILQKKTGVGYTLRSVTNTTGTQNEIRWVIERLCTNTGVALASHCVMSSTSGKQSAGGTLGGANIVPPGGPMYRVTVRVDGPKNTVSIVQAMLR